MKRSRLWLSGTVDDGLCQNCGKRPAVTNRIYRGHLEGHVNERSVSDVWSVCEPCAQECDDKAADGLDSCVYDSPIRLYELVSWS